VKPSCPKSWDGARYETACLMNLYDEFLESLDYGISDRAAVAQALQVIMQRHNLSADQAREYLCGDLAGLGVDPAHFARLVLDASMLAR
jgi:hypothetical protein